jgi:hypothetical protein
MFVEVSQWGAPSQAHLGFGDGGLRFPGDIGQARCGNGECQCEYGWMNARTHMGLERFMPSERNTLHPLWLYCSCLYESVV